MFDELPIYVLFLLSLVSFVASFFNAISGGGGLITVPCLLYAGISPITALGTNKLQTVFADISSIWHFSKQKQVSHKAIIYPLIITVCGAITGTIALSQVDIKHLIPFILLAVFIYYVWPKKINSPVDGEINYKRLYFIAPFISFYNGFFGPGTGSIWTVSLIKLLHLDLRRAAMHTRSLNFVGNIGSLCVFLLLGNVNIPTALVMGMGAMLGGAAGARFVTHKDIKIINRCFIVLMSLIIISMFYKYYMQF